MSGFTSKEQLPIMLNVNHVALVLGVSSLTDMFETSRFDDLEVKIEKQENSRHEEVLKEMIKALT